MRSCSNVRLKRLLSDLFSVSIHQLIHRLLLPVSMINRMRNEAGNYAASQSSDASISTSGALAANQATLSAAYCEDSQ